MWNRDKYGNAMKIAFTLKFQWEPDQYSTELNIQNPGVESRFWEAKTLAPNNQFMLARVKVVGRHY